MVMYFRMLFAIRNEKLNLTTFIFYLHLDIHLVYSGIIMDLSVQIRLAKGRYKFTHDIVLIIYESTDSKRPGD